LRILKNLKILAAVKMEIDDLNYSFLSRTFSSLSPMQKDKILQILNNTSKIEKAV
jgi:hypothetical protein